MAVIAAVVAALKHYSPISCPWDLPEFGGAKPDAGRCLPAAQLVGFVAGAVQVARGAHFPSHVLWTAWIAWGVTLALTMVGRVGIEPTTKGL